MPTRSCAGRSIARRSSTRASTDAALHVAHWADACGSVRLPEHLAAYVRGWCAMHAAGPRPRARRARRGRREQARRRRPRRPPGPRRRARRQASCVGDAPAWLDKHHSPPTTCSTGSRPPTSRAARRPTPSSSSASSCRTASSARTQGHVPCAPRARGPAGRRDRARLRSARRSREPPAATGLYLATSWTLPSDLHDRVTEDIAAHCDGDLLARSAHVGPAHLRGLSRCPARWPGAGPGDRWPRTRASRRCRGDTSEVEAFALTAIDNWRSLAAATRRPTPARTARDLKYLPDHDRALDSRIDAVGADRPASADASLVDGPFWSRATATRPRLRPPTSPRPSRSRPTSPPRRSRRHPSPSSRKSRSRHHEHRVADPRAWPKVVADGVVDVLPCARHKERSPATTRRSRCSPAARRASSARGCATRSSPARGRRADPDLVKPRRLRLVPRPYDSTTATTASPAGSPTPSLSTA